MNKKQYLYSNLFAWGLVLLLITNYVFGWTIPSQDPPGGNIVLETGATPAGSTGYIQFNDNGNLGADSNLFWDNTNKYLGIGTASPQGDLDVKGFTTETLSFTDITDGILILAPFGQGTDRDIMGSIYVQRSSGLYNIRRVDVLYSSAASNTNYDAYVEYTGSTYDSSWNLVSFDYDGTTWVGLRRQGSDYWQSTAFFVGENTYKGARRFEWIDTSAATNLSTLSYSGMKKTITSDPTADNHVATKGYVDSVSSGVDCPTCYEWDGTECVPKDEGTLDDGCSDTHYRCDGTGNCTAPTRTVCRYNSSNSSCNNNCEEWYMSYWYKSCVNSYTNSNCTGSYLSCRHSNLTHCKCEIYVY